jgi:hypothetical protein
MRAHRKARCFDPDQYALTITIAAARSVACRSLYFRNSSGSLATLAARASGLAALSAYPAALLLLFPKAAHLGVRQWNGSSGKHR